MSTGQPGSPGRDASTTSSRGEAGSADLSGISELFGLHRDPAADSTRTSADTADRWVSATEGTVYGSNDPSGRLVHGRYRLIAELGSGGMGVTYRAWDTQAGLPVVVKMPKREVRHDREVMARFSREIAAMAAVPHESIVPITDSGDDAGCPFVVMRFLPGGSLADYRRRDEAGKPIKNPPGMLFYWLPGIAAALDRIHARRLLHRDVKPGNIFLDGFLKPYLGDFGIAKVVDDSGGLEKEQTLTATRMAVGTPEYMAPELFRPRVQPDGRVDQYALAVTVYEMLSGEKPFTGSTAHIVVEHSSLPVPPLEKRCPGLRPGVYEAVHKALSKDPEERFGTCEDFAAAVLEGIKPLEPEADTVRLLCPSCRNILKLPQRAAGKKGRCPRCQSVMDVAQDLGSLWLESEERGGGRRIADVLEASESAEGVTHFEPYSVLDVGLVVAHAALLVFFLLMVVAEILVFGLYGFPKLLYFEPMWWWGLFVDYWWFLPSIPIGFKSAVFSVPRLYALKSELAFMISSIDRERIYFRSAWSTQTLWVSVPLCTIQCAQLWTRRGPFPNPRKAILRVRLRSRPSEMLWSPVLGVCASPTAMQAVLESHGIEVQHTDAREAVWGFPKFFRPH
jgi:serine/threonine protein kinase